MSFGEEPFASPNIHTNREFARDEDVDQNMSYAPRRNCIWLFDYPLDFPQVHEERHPYSC